MFSENDDFKKISAVIEESDCLLKELGFDVFISSKTIPRPPPEEEIFACNLWMEIVKGFGDSTCIKQLKTYSLSQNRSIRLLAVQTLRGLSEKECNDSLLRLIESSDPDSLADGLSLSALFGAKIKKKKLQKCILSENERVRTAAIEYMVRTGDRRGPSLIRSSLKEAVESNRGNIPDLLSIANLLPEKDEETLLRIIEISSNPELPEIASLSARSILDDLPQNTKENLYRKIMKNPDVSDFAKAAAFVDIAASGLRSTEINIQASVWLEGKASIKNYIAEELGKAQRRSVIPILIRLASDSDENVALKSLESLNALGAIRSGDMRELMFRISEKNENYKTLVLELLKKSKINELDEPVILKHLSSLIKDESSNIRALVWSVLATEEFAHRAPQIIDAASDESHPKAICAAFDFAVEIFEREGPDADVSRSVLRRLPEPVRSRIRNMEN